MEAKNIVITILVILSAFLLFTGDTSAKNQPVIQENLSKNSYYNNYIYTEETSSNTKNDYDYCDYVEYGCERGDYDCYFGREKECGSNNNNKKIVYVINEDTSRYPISDYDYGYTYRTSQEYLGKYEKKVLTKQQTVEKKDTGIYYYYKYIPYLKKYEKIVCYKNAPANKLFYEKCPEF